MRDNSAAKVNTIGFQELKSLLKMIFLNNRTSPETAEILAENCAGCERDGALSHGIFRIPGYIDSLRSGWVDGLVNRLLSASALLSFV